MSVALANRRERYVESSVNAEIEKLANTSSGRNPALRDASRSLGGFVAAGVLSEAEAIALLIQASEVNGYIRKDGRAAAMSTIRSGLREGMKKARKLPVDGERTTQRARPVVDSISAAEGAARALVALKEACDAPVYLPTDEVARLWGAGGRVDADPKVAAWLADDRRIDPIKISDIDAARVLRPDAQVPSWAGFGGEDGKPWRSWLSAGLRLVVPLFDQTGTMRSLLFRRAYETQASFPPKSVGARGGRRGLAMMCPLARQVLGAGRLPEWWPADRELRVIVCEGEADYLTVCSEWSEADETAPACIGGFSGSWEVLEALPAGCTLVVRTDADEAGAKYATQILQAVYRRWQALEIAIDMPSYFDVAGWKVTLK